MSYDPVDDNRLTSDDILLADPRLGRCHLCPNILLIEHLTQVQLDEPKNWVSLCPVCLEKEMLR